VIPIRPAEERDADAIAELLGQLGYAATAASVRDRIRKMIAGPGVVVLVADDSGTRAVCGVATFHLLSVLHEDAPRGQLTTLVVSKSQRRKGMGVALVQRVEQLAAQQGVATLVVTTANHRTDAHHLYDRLGYSWTGRRYVKELGPGATEYKQLRSSLQPDFHYGCAFEKVVASRPVWDVLQPVNKVFYPLLLEAVGRDEESVRAPLET